MSAADLPKLLADLADAQHQRAQIEERERDLKSAILAAVNGQVGKREVGDVTLDVQTNRRFNETKALAAVPEPVLDLVTTMTRKVDRKKLEVICPDAFAAAWDVYAPKVVLR